ncbi:transcription repressor OFP8-like [Miscanthus floridulus]|uniref:transcription repressor OFP8-like n=1 Tax=Miscanthus floridulus TaxID=154761 RepID=UPI0034576487
MSSTRARRGGSLQFPVGRSWRHVAVVDAGCGCRPRRAATRLLSQLPSFLRPSPKPPQAPPRSSSRSSSGFFPSSASTASSAATFATTHSSYSAYSYNNPTTAAAAAVTKHPPAKAPAAAATGRRRQQGGHQGRRKKRYEKMAAASAAEAAAGEDGDGDVGVAVEKESSDPRADFRESMVQMVVEMGLCGWDDLRCMLRRLLALNAPRHHAAILAAFAEVCAQLTAPPPPQPAYHAYDYHYHY